LWCGKDKAFRERPFALHRQQPEKDEPNVDVAFSGKFLQTPMRICIENNRRKILNLCVTYFTNQENHCHNHNQTPFYFCCRL